MFRVFNCLVTEHDLRLVVIAGLICFLASFTAISLFGRARSLSGRARATWIVAAGTATGCGIWASVPTQFAQSRRHPRISASSPFEEMLATLDPAGPSGRDSGPVSRVS